MDILKVKTKRGLELRGAIYDCDNTDIVAIIVTGICSNVFQNDLLDATAKLLQQNNITTIIAHAHDSFSCFSYTDYSINNQKTTGVFDDDFTLVYEDVESYIKYAKEVLGYKKVVLIGHSLGSNKIINYMGNTKDDYIDFFIISSPVDLAYWFEVMPNVDKCIELAKSWVEKGRGDDILPMLFGGFSPMRAKTVLNFLNAENLKNCPVLSKKGETKSLYNIKPHGTFIIGSKDSVTGNSPKLFMEQLNNWTKNPDKNDVIELEGASHIFYNMHNEYAQIILNIIKNHN